MFAAIDIGSNTVRLLIADVSADGALIPLRYERRVTRLAGGLSVRDGLTSEAMQRTLSALQEFRDICRQHPVASLLTVGTAAFRNACNGNNFADQIFETTSIPVQIISGDQEAGLNAAGTLLMRSVAQDTLIFDIGGGSTEFVHLVDGQVQWTDSLPLGVVYLCEEFTDSTEREKFIRESLDKIYPRVASRSVKESSELTLIGTAGTVTSLAAMDMQMVDYDWRRVNKHRLQRDRLEKLSRQLEVLTPLQREALPGLEPGRGDLIMPGLQIVLLLLEIFDCEQLSTSDFGLLEGLILKQADESGKVRRN